MPRFYSPEWIAAFNEAVGDLAPPPPPGAAEPVGPDGAGRPAADPAPGAVGGRSRFKVAQLVSGTPGGDLRVVLEVDGDRLRLVGGDAVTDVEPDVTVVLSYEDAGALSRGEMDAAQLIGTGRLKVRGNLSLLVAGQALLAAAADRLAPLAASTTY